MFNFEENFMLEERQYFNVLCVCVCAYTEEDDHDDDDCR